MCEVILGVLVFFALRVRGKLKYEIKDSDILKATIAYIINSGLDKMMDNYYALTVIPDEMKNANAIWNLFVGISFVSISCIFIVYSDQSSIDRIMFTISIAISGVINIFQFILRYDGNDRFVVMSLFVVLFSNLGLVTSIFYMYYEHKIKAFISGGIYLPAAMGCIIRYLKMKEDTC